MSLLQEVALTPDVFLESGYSQPAFCDLCLGMLQPALLGETVVRDLRDGLWSRQFSNGPLSLHPAGQKLLKALAEANRLVPAPAELDSVPSEPVEWGREAQASHKRIKLSAIICGRHVHRKLDGPPRTLCVETIHESDWWRKRSCSVRLRRTTADYRQHLDPVLRCSTSLMFIDPHLDPSRSHYSEFHQLLESANGQRVRPSIELHRVCYESSGRDRRILKLPELQECFADLGQRLHRAGLHAGVFVWDDFHDRYLISNLVGISIPNGFDTTKDKNAQTTWTRLSSRDRDDVQREFDPAASRHELKFRFPIGG